jgi:CubicO group peptidase (beta-lactamase class C family)
MLEGMCVNGVKRLCEEKACVRVILRAFLFVPKSLVMSNGRLLPVTVCVSLALLTLLAACASAPPAQSNAPVDASSNAPFDTVRLAEIDRSIQSFIDQKQLPGAVYRLEHNGAIHEKAIGRFTYESDATPMSPDTVFDAASLTKVLATAPAIMMLMEEGKLSLDAPLIRYMPECAGGGRDALTIRHLLTHTSGLPSGLPRNPPWRGTDSALALACRQTTTHAPGTMFRYSDINFVLLGELVHRLSGMPLDEFAARRIYAPLRMRDTGFRPLTRIAPARIAPTQYIAGVPSPDGLHADLTPGYMLQGVVHDPTARLMDGVAGSAGLFTTAADIARYARMMLNEGELDGVRILSAESVRRMTTVQSPPGIAARRSAGWDIDSPYSRPRGTLFPIGSYGHTGFTGCILWIDPASKAFYIFLSNRVYPKDGTNIVPLYTMLGTLSAQAVGYRGNAPAP